MRKVVARGAAMLLLMGCATSTVGADVGGCSTDDIVKMKKGGLTASEIRELCSDDSSEPDGIPRQFPRGGSVPRPGPGQAAPAIARICTTTWGMCPMQVPVPIGSSCTCFNAYGQFPGIAR
jgi:hypothetical protein